MAMKFCRTCGSSCTPVKVKRAAGAKTKGFFAKLPGAFGYPFRGFGLMILFLATGCFGAVDYLETIGLLGGPIGWIIWAAFYGLLFLFMQNIIHTTASDENETLGFPDAGELFGGAFQMGFTILVCFGLPIGLLIARIFEVEVPMVAIIGSVIVGSLYFPMAFLAVAMKDTVLAMNPMVVVPTILRIPGEYLVATILLMSVFGINLLGNMVSGVAGGAMLETRDMKVLLGSLGIQAVWSFVSIYLLSVNMRILGLLYVTKKEKFGWF
ncbi:MAG: hypothetical protein ABL962_22095 [Fimbriimonadaceae bacterium]